MPGDFPVMKHAELERELNYLKDLILLKAVPNGKKFLTLNQRKLRVAKIINNIRRSAGIMITQSMISSVFQTGTKFLPPNIRIPVDKKCHQAGSWVKIVFDDNTFVAGIVTNVEIQKFGKTQSRLRYHVLLVNKKRYEFDNSFERVGYMYSNNDRLWCYITTLDLPGKLWVMRHKFKKLGPYIRKWKENRIK